VACEQRSAIAWLETMDMMLGHKGKSKAVKAMAKASGQKVSGYTCCYSLVS
jgi:hypothetical protein